MKAPRIVLLVLALAAPAPLVRATTAVRLSNQAMTDRAELIVIGRAEERRSAWVGRRLVTLVTVSVSETVKGAAGSTITVALPGGIDARRKVKVAMTYPGAPTLGPNEEVFLFLAASDEVGGAFTVAGFAQGKFSIVENVLGEKCVSRDLTDLGLQDLSGFTRGTVTLELLSQFKQEIRQHLARAPGWE